MRRRCVAGALVLVALVGCGDDGTAPEEQGAATSTTEAGTTTSGSVSTSTSSTAPPVDDAAAVLEAYAAHWSIFDDFLNGEPPGDPADFFAGERLADLPASIADFAERGIRVEGEPVLDPGPVTIDGDRASFTDCHLDATTAVSRTTGEVVFAPATEPVLTAVELLRVDGVWKVSSVIYGTEPCIQD